MAVERRRKVVLQQDPYSFFLYVYPFMCLGPFAENPLERIHLYTSTQPELPLGPGNPCFFVCGPKGSLVIWRSRAHTYDSRN